MRPQWTNRKQDLLPGRSKPMNASDRAHFIVTLLCDSVQVLIYMISYLFMLTDMFDSVQVLIYMISYLFMLTVMHIMLHFFTLFVSYPVIEPVMIQ